MFLDGGNVFGVAANPTHAYPVSENHTSPNALSTKCVAAASHVEECKRSDAETMSALDLLAPAHQPAQIIELFRSACTVEGADGGEPHTPFTPHSPPYTRQPSPNHRPIPPQQSRAQTMVSPPSVQTLPQRRSHGRTVCVRRATLLGRVW